MLEDFEDLLYALLLFLLLPPIATYRYLAAIIGFHHVIGYVHGISIYRGMLLVMCLLCNRQVSQCDLLARFALHRQDFLCWLLLVFHGDIWSNFWLFSILKQLLLFLQLVWLTSSSLAGIRFLLWFRLLFLW